MMLFGTLLEIMVTVLDQREYPSQRSWWMCKQDTVTSLRSERMLHPFLPT
jgi:hypothetical protein